jgi:hypothetical protein
MRFLIFNITVLAALGFLFTSAPNQSFPQWAAATLDLWAEPDETTESDNQSGDVAQSGKRFAKAIAQVASDKIKAIDSSAAAPNTAQAERQVASDFQTVSLDKPQPQPQAQRMSSEAIKDLIIAVIDEQKATEALVGVQQDSGGDSATAISQLKKPAEVGLEQDAGDTYGDTLQANVKQELAEMNDDEIARAFEAFEKAAVSSSSPGSETAFEMPVTSGSIEPTKPNFMTSSQRSADLAQMIESLNLIYFEKTGI